MINLWLLTCNSGIQSIQHLGSFLIIERVTMNVQDTQNNEAFSCCRCNSSISSYHNANSAVWVTTERSYQESKKNFGMYCPECDHSICLECLDSLNSISDLEEDASRHPLNPRFVPALRNLSALDGRNEWCQRLVDQRPQVRKLKPRLYFPSS